MGPDLSSVVPCLGDAVGVVRFKKGPPVTTHLQVIGRAGRQGVVLVARRLGQEGQLGPGRDALSDSGSSDQKQRPLALLAPRIDVVEPAAMNDSTFCISTVDFKIS